MKNITLKSNCTECGKAFSIVTNDVNKTIGNICDKCKNRPQQKMFRSRRDD